MRSTGSAEGPYNLRLSSRSAGWTRAEMLGRLGTGLFVTGLQGRATNPITGNWTRAVIGFRVEDGAIVHAVEDVTLGGAIPAMMKGIIAVGDEVERNGAIRTGSIVIDDMQVGGDA